MTAATEVNSYLPFRGLSAWFSSSVRPAQCRKWDQYGGFFAKETEADYLFSDNASSADTVRVYNTQPGVTVFLSAWVSDVISGRLTVHDVPLGQHLLLPHYLAEVSVSENPFTTPNTSTAGEQRRGELSHCMPGSNLSRLLAKREAKIGGREGGRRGGEHIIKLRNSRQFFSPVLEQTDVSVTLAMSAREPEEGVCIASHGGYNTGSTVTGCAVSSYRDTRTHHPSAPQGENSLHIHDSSPLGGKTLHIDGSQAAWRELMCIQKTTRYEDILYINDVDIQDAVLMDFDPYMPQFTMKRK